VIASAAAISGVEVVARVVIGLTLVYAGLAKIAGGKVFLTSLRRLPIPRFLVSGDERLRAMAVGIPTVEIALGSTFALGLWPYTSGALVVLLLLAFSAVLVRALRNMPISTCACFGRIARIHKRSLGRNAAFVGLTVVGMQGQDTGRLLSLLAASWSPAIWALIVVCLILAALVVILALRVRELLAALPRTAPRVATAPSPTGQPVAPVQMARTSERPVPDARRTGQRQGVFRDAEQAPSVRPTDRRRILEEGGGRPGGQGSLHQNSYARGVDPVIPEEHDPRSCTDVVYAFGSARVFGGRAAGAGTRRDTREKARKTVWADRNGRGDLVHVHRARSGIRAFRMHVQAQARPHEFFSRYAEVLGLGANDAMEQYAQGDLEAGRSYTKFLQRHRGVVVDGAEGLLTHNEVVLSGSSSIVAGLDVAVEPQITKERALDLAREWVATEAGLTNVELDGEPSCELLITTKATSPHLDVRRKGPWRLVYRCRLFLPLPRAPYTVDVDALSGGIVRARQDWKLAWQPATGTGLSVYNDQVTFECETDDVDGTSRLHSPTVLTQYSLAKEEKQLVETAGTVEVLGQNGTFSVDDAPAVSVHWAAQQVTQYLSKAFHRDGVTGRGGLTRHYPNLDLVGSFMSSLLDWIVIYKDKPVAEVQFDLVGHEMGHGVVKTSVGPTQYTGLGNDGEPGALEESFADIIATLAEFDRLGDQADWVVTYGDPDRLQRYLDNPEGQPYPGPTTYGTSPWWVDPKSTYDDGGIHFNCCVQNFWFYMLSEGRSGFNDNGEWYDVTGIGKEKAGQIVYRSLTTKLVNGATFHDAREAATRSAEELFGQASQEAFSTANAWYAVGVGPASQPIRVPEDGAPDVEPWDCLLQWEWPPVSTEGCEVQISSAEDYTSDTVTIPVPLTADHVGMLGAIPVAQTSVPLIPGKQYFWRLREAAPAPEVERSWSPTSTFFTASKKPVLLQPKECRGGFHPWELRFKWEEVPGAQEYTLEVAKDQKFESLLLKPIKQQGTTCVLDVTIGSSLWWRITAAHQVDPDTWYTATSDPIPFTTIRPRVALADPVNGSSGRPGVYPWGLWLSWEPEIGADSYEVELAQDDPNIDESTHGLTRNPRYWKDIPSGTEVEVNLPAQLPDQDVYVWRVTVVGPTIDGANGPFQERGDPSKLWRFAVDGTGTIVQPIEPPPLYPYAPPCVSFGFPVTFRWGNVPMAHSYRLRIHEATGVEGQPLQDSGIYIFDRTYPHDPSVNEQVHTVDHVSGPMSGAPYTIGYLWRVQAIGPKDPTGNDLVGLEGDQNAYYVQPTQPWVITPSQNQPFESDDEVPFVWTTDMAHFGRFLYHLYSDSYCQRLIDHDEILGKTSGPSTWSFGVLKPGLYSCQVTPKIADGCFNPSDLPWSPCIPFNVLEPPPPEPQPTGQCADVVKQGGINPETHVIEMGRTSGTFLFSFNTFDFDDRIQVMYEDRQLFDSGCIGTHVSVDNIPLTFGGTWSVIKVIVDPNCNPANRGLTEWYFTVGCPF
jgi:Zn-dependent metalloprotease